MNFHCKRSDLLLFKLNLLVFEVLIFALNAFLKVISELAKTSTITNVMTQMTDSIKDSGLSSHEGNSSSGQYYDKDCSECHIVRKDPTPNELTMCLHALCYKVSNIDCYIIRQC